VSNEERLNTNIRGLALALIVFLLALVYAVPATSSGNLLWFIRSLDAEPSQIVTYRDGTRTVHLPGTPGYRALSPLCTKALQEVGGLDDSGLSPATLDDIRKGGKAVEVYFPKAITIPTSLRVGKPNQVFIPLDDKYAMQAVAFTGNDGQYWAQALRIRAAYDQISAAFDDVTRPK
jgi:hypothetical protein